MCVYVCRKIFQIINHGGKETVNTSKGTNELEETLNTHFYFIVGKRLGESNKPNQSSHFYREEKSVWESHLEAFILLQEVIFTTQ